MQNISTVGTRVHVISPADSKVQLQSGDAVLIDVREPEEYNEKHIRGAILIPLGILDYDLLLRNNIDCSKNLIMQCRSGKRSLHACEKLLQDNDQLKLYNLKGGILQWIQDLENQDIISP